MSFLREIGVYTEDVKYVVFGDPWVISNGSVRLEVPEFDVGLLQESLTLSYLQTLSNNPLLKLWKPFIRVKEIMFRRTSFEYIDKEGVTVVAGDTFRLPERSLELIYSQLELSKEMMNLAELLRPKMSPEMFYLICKEQF